MNAKKIKTVQTIELALTTTVLILVVNNLAVKALFARQWAIELFANVRQIMPAIRIENATLVSFKI